MESLTAAKDRRGRRCTSFRRFQQIMRRYGGPSKEAERDRGRRAREQLLSLLFLSASRGDHEPALRNLVLGAAVPPCWRC